MNNKTTVWVIVLVVVAGGAFWGGMQYAKSSTPATAVRTAGSGSYTGARGTRTAGGGFTSGQIVSSDATSITIQMQSGSSQVVFYSPTTQIMKSTSGSAADLAAGVNVMISGTTNSDGSLTANSIQIRPAGMTGGAPGSGASAPASAQ